ncbi:hypothetical protein BJY01DRAFT_61332 [Aspergillus pseudoustus]|uniref:Secreted protein n=1 Tax=Aspergillus pseudoustus TaxID=1810923 RepID=A0ABR4J7T6_9EURO
MFWPIFSHLRRLPLFFPFLSSQAFCTILPDPCYFMFIIPLSVHLGCCCNLPVSSTRYALLSLSTTVPIKTSIQGYSCSPFLSHALLDHRGFPRGYAVK